jgi:hypothetical protein
MDAKIETLLLPIAKDIPLYKRYVEECFHRVEVTIQNKFGTHDATLAQLQSSMEIVGRHFSTAGDRFGLIEEAMNRLHDSKPLLQGGFSW